jgi:carboxypeptidase Taq
MKYYEKLKELNSEYYTLGHILEFLDHDRDAEMPPKASEFKGIQLGLLAKLQNRIMKNPEWNKIFEECRNSGELTEEEKIDTEETYRIWVHESAVPEELVGKLADTVANSTRIWADVKNGKANFKDIQPYLENIFNLNREIAEKKSNLLKLPIYDCLLDKYQPGLKSDKINAVFSDLKKFIPDILTKIQQKKLQKATPLNAEAYPKDKKEKFVRQLLKVIGYDFDRGRLSEVIHPHMVGLAPDIVIAVNYKSDPIDLSFSSIHECGHAVYQQNLTDYLRTIGQQRGMAIHESQSLFFEMQIGRSNAFVPFLAKIMREHFGNIPELSDDNISTIVRHVEPSFIRIHADEVTYPLHVIMRYEIEKGIIDGQIKVKDLPEIWNAKMKEYLGIVPPTDAIGCLQDCHWPCGLVGYFPSYTFGAVIAAQLMSKIRKDLPNIEKDIANGNLARVREWLYNNVYKYGASLDFENLVKTSTGKELSTDDFKEYLNNKYLS